jgi:hypothetical protein
LSRKKKRKKKMKLFSGDNSKTDVKAVLSVLACFMALAIYLAYAVKGLLMAWDMPPSIRDITVALIVSGILGAGSTLLNQKLGVALPPDCEKHKPPPGDSPAGPAG